MDVLNNKKLNTTFKFMVFLAMFSSGTIILLNVFRLTLVDILTPFILPFFEILVYLWFIISFIVSCIYFVNGLINKSPLKSYPIFIHILSVIIILIVPFTAITLEFDYKFNKKQRDIVVSMVLDNRLVPNVNHNQTLILLPDKFKSLSKGGGEIVVVGDGQQKQILFFTFRGVIDNMAGFIFTTNGQIPDEELFNTHFIEIKRFGNHWFWVSAT